MIYWYFVRTIHEKHLECAEKFFSVPIDRYLVVERYSNDIKLINVPLSSYIHTICACMFPLLFSCRCYGFINVQCTILQEQWGYSFCNPVYAQISVIDGYGCLAGHPICLIRICSIRPNDLTEPSANPPKVYYGRMWILKF